MVWLCCICFYVPHIDLKHLDLDPTSSSSIPIKQDELWRLTCSMSRLWVSSATYRFLIFSEFPTCNLFQPFYVNQVYVKNAFVGRISRLSRIITMTRSALNSGINFLREGCWHMALHYLSSLGGIFCIVDISLASWINT